MKSEFLEKNGIVNLISGMEYSLSYAKEGEKVKDYVKAVSYTHLTLPTTPYV